MPKYIENEVDYDPCDDCRENEDDFYQDENGDWMMRCYDCPLWERSEDST